jgi:hypothetical protein
MNRSQWTATICASAGVLLFAQAARPAEYRIPTGFNGHAWAEPFTELPGIRLWHANKTQSDQVEAVQRPFCPSTAGGCDVSRLWGVQQSLELPNTFALAEYYLNVDSNPWASSGVRLYTISYLYCASETGHDIPSPVKAHLRLCGARVIFQSEKPDQLARQPSGYRSNFDRIMRRLVADYGEPPGHDVHGKITIQSMNGDEVTATPADSRPAYVVYRWCPVISDRTRPDCKATVTVEFEATQGEGTVLFATPELYDFANARHGIGDQKNDIYLLLYDHVGQLQPRQRELCTGKRVCNPVEAQMTARDMRDFEP